MAVVSIYKKLIFIFHLDFDLNFICLFFFSNQQ